MNVSSWYCNLYRNVCVTDANGATDNTARFELELPKELEAVHSVEMFEEEPNNVKRARIIITIKVGEERKKLILNCSTDLGDKHG